MDTKRFRYLTRCLFIGLALWIGAGLGANARAAEFRLSGKVLIQYDTFGVPHILATNDADLHFAQGFITAGDRLWQMEYERRLVSGRLAEILGKDLVDQDFEIRRIGIYRSSIAAYDSMSEEMKMLTAAYAAGVNYYITTHKDNLPHEFKELGYVPEPWHPVDSIAIPRLMFWHLSGSLDEELMLGRLVDELGAEKALELVSGEPADPETHIKWNRASAAIPKGFGKNGFKILSGLKDLSTGGSAMRFIGSNNWVIDGEKSATGAPILANDPHLSLLNPPIWQEIHLIGPGVNVIGSTFPGVPGVIIGHNERIAWGVTNAGYDVCDLYVEQLSPKDRSLYMHKGRARHFKKSIEKIRYKSGDSMKEIEKEILFTVHGPVVHEEDGEVISMRWTGHDPSPESRFLYLLDRVSNLEEFKAALNHYHIGAQNFIYADIDGNIFYQPTGKVPIRNGAPYLPLDGSSGKYEWEDYIPYDELPKALNPEEHFIATANARPVDLSYPYYIGYLFDIGYRIRRIKDLLQAKEKMTFEDVQAIQADNRVLAAERLKPFLLASVESESPRMQKRALEASKIVEQWDNNATIDSAGCAIFNKWLERIALNTLKDDLSKDSFEHWASNPDIIVQLLVRSATPNRLKHDWFDNTRTTTHETGRQIIARSLQEAVDALGLMSGFDMTDWKWGEIHPILLRHGLGDTHPRYNNGPYPRGGSNDTVDNAWFPFFEEGFQSLGGPSLRMTVELTPGVEHAVNAIPGGQSGDPSSKHYQDQLLDLWLEHKAHPMLFTKKQILDNLEQSLTMEPAE